jgi:NTP pyrophosphatase (non-canonical NTP hydrolase)
MQTKELQTKIIEFLSKWDKERNDIPTKQKTFTHLIEEVGELARQYVNEETRKEQYDEEEVKNAIGDIFIQLVRLADLHGLDIEETITEIIKEEGDIFKS